MSEDRFHVNVPFNFLEIDSVDEVQPIHHVDGTSRVTTCGAAVGIVRVQYRKRYFFDVVNASQLWDRVTCDHCRKP